MEIDLSDKQGEYELILNTDISSYSTNKGYVVITEDTETPTYSNATDKILDTSGTYSNVETRATLIGGKIYYVHFGYTKTNQNSNADTFTINSAIVSILKLVFADLKFDSNITRAIVVLASGIVTFGICYIYNLVSRKADEKEKLANEAVTDEMPVDEAKMDENEGE